MALETRSSAILSFGTFEVDLRAGELRKQSKRIRLQEQPFRVLTVLLQRPGDVVTREELRSQIWPEDTFVDFDNSLNTAINKLREALGDSADNPRFIETLPRRGYRFLAPVSGENVQTVRSATAYALKWKIACAGLVVLATVGAAFYWRSHGPGLLTEKDILVLGDFSNSTGDPVFDGALREGLSVQLEQSPFLSLVSEEGIHQTLRMMGQPANARLTREVTREVCQRTNSTAALDGSITLIGTRYTLILKAVNCANGDLLASTEAQASDKSHVLDALSKATSQIRVKLGESLSTVEKYNTPLEQATTTSLEALQAYSLGFKADGAGDQAAALSFYQRATQIDPNFAMGYLGMAGEYGLMGESLLALENGRKAFSLRDRVSALEKLIIEEEYDFYMSGDLPKALKICELGERIYPRVFIFHEDRGQGLAFLGKYEESLKESLETLRLAPYRGVDYRELAHTNLYLNRVDEAEAAAKQAHAKNMDANLADVFYGIAFYRQEKEEMTRQFARSVGVPGVEHLLLALEADTAAYSGHLRKARELSRRAADSADEMHQKEESATYRAVSTFREALLGNVDIARRQTAVSRGHLLGRDVDYAAALAFAYAGSAGSTQALADALSENFPEDTVVQFNYLPTLRAKLALLRANPQEALHSLEPAAPFELGLPAVGLYNWPNLYPVYVRGEAYLAAHQGREAAVEFQKILDHRGVVLNEPIGAIAHLQLGRAYALQGDAAKARASYQDFLTLWKDADPDVPVLLQAKAEYATLQ